MKKLSFIASAIMCVVFAAVVVLFLIGFLCKIKENRSVTNTSDYEYITYGLFKEKSTGVIYTNHGSRLVPVVDNNGTKLTYDELKNVTIKD